MQRSTDRILTTHTGSLPRPDDLVAMVAGKDQQEVQRDAVFDRRVTEAVHEIVQKQVEAGVDVINDGEASKVGYATYVTERLTGFEGASRPSPAQVEAADFPEFYQARVPGPATIKRPVCTGPISWRGDALVQRDIANLKVALEGVTAVDTFMTAASPGWCGIFSRMTTTRTTTRTCSRSRMR